MDQGGGIGLVTFRLFELLPVRYLISSKGNDSGMGCRTLKYLRVVRS